VISIIFALGISLFFIYNIAGIINGLLHETNRLTQAAVNGQLSTRGDPEHIAQEFRGIVTGVNATLDAVIQPLNVSADYVDRIAKGEIPPKITDHYNGDFNTIKTNINQCIDGLDGLVEANKVLQLMANNDYTQQVNGQYQGIFAEVGQAVNDVQQRVSIAIQVAKHISVGDLSDITMLKAIGNGQGRRCEHDELAPSFIHMEEAILTLVDDMKTLSQNAVTGQLSVRADTSRHLGEFRMIVQGVNDTLDAVIDPVNEASGVLAQLAEKDLTARVVGNYRGDHAKIKDNLNGACAALEVTVQEDMGIVAQVAEAADQMSLAADSVGKASQEVASGAQQVATGSEMQSTSAMEAANNMEQLKRADLHRAVRLEEGSGQ
jgi:methyl-accepting chemotaxis protein